jgi:hypothetical protein
MPPAIRNRIKGHRRVRAADLLPHEWNYRLHPDHQRDALAALYRKIGFARSLLAYELPDGRLKLIDGHLRRDMDPDMEVEVEILDVTESEARELLLSIDPLVQLGQMQQQLDDRLRQTTPTANPELQALWQEAARQSVEDLERARKPIGQEVPAQFMVLVMCKDEKQQVQLIERFLAEGLHCKALQVDGRERPLAGEFRQQEAAEQHAGPSDEPLMDADHRAVVLLNLLLLGGQPGDEAGVKVLLDRHPRYRFLPALPPPASWPRSPAAWQSGQSHPRWEREDRQARRACRQRRWSARPAQRSIDPVSTAPTRSRRISFTV